MTRSLTVEAPGKFFEGVVVLRFVSPPFLNDPAKGEVCCVHISCHLAKKSMTPTVKGISIQNAVRRAHAGWPSSHRKMHVLKSVRTSKRLKSTLKNVNFKIWNILKEQRKPLLSKSDHFWAPIWISFPQIKKKTVRGHRIERMVIPAFSRIFKLTESFNIGQAYLKAVLNEGKWTQALV